MDIRFLEVDRVTIPLILLLGFLSAAGYLLARRWPPAAWLVLVLVALTAIRLAQELVGLWSLDLHPTLRRTVLLEAIVAILTTVAAVILPLRARSHRTSLPRNV